MAAYLFFIRFKNQYVKIKKNLFNFINNEFLQKLHLLDL